MYNQIKSFITKPGKAYVGYIKNETDFTHTGKDLHSLVLTIIDYETKNSISDIPISPSPKTFIEIIPQLFGESFKAIIFNVFTFVAEGYENNLRFCQAVKAKLDSIKILYYFFSKNDCVSTCILAAAKIRAGENLLIIKLEGFNERYEIEELCYSTLGYKKVDHGFFYLAEIEPKPSAVKDKITSYSTTKNIVMATRSQNNLKFQILFTSLKPLKPLILDFDEIEKKTLDAVIGLTRWLLDKNDVRMFIIPRCQTRSGIFCKMDNRQAVGIKPMVFSSFREEMFGKYLKFDDCDAEVSAANELLPFRKSFIVAKPFVKDYSFKYIDTSKFDWICFSVKKEYTFDLTLKKEGCHRNEIFLSIDYNNFPSFKIQPVIIEAIKELPKTLKNFSTKIPIIAFFDQSSVICIHQNDENGYDFVEQWKGMLGKELFISFTNEKPKYGEKASDDYEKNPSFVVCDLMKIMSMSPDTIFPDEKWKFAITKNEENPILLEFDTFDGTKKAASPAFLMAMLLKQHRKAIKKVTGKAPKEFGFILFDEFQDSEAKKRVEDGIKEACELLKVECSFFDV